MGYDIRIHPLNKNRMYVTDNFAGVIRSDNAGATWSAVNQGISARSGPLGDTTPIFSLTIDPNDPNIVWAGTNGGGAVFGIFKSIDGGDNWTLKTNGVSASPQGLVFRGFTVQPGDSNVVYAMAEVPTTIQGREFNRVQGRVYKSVSGGDYWNLLWQGDNLARYLIVDPSNSATLYLSTGIFDREAYNSDCGAGIPGGVGVLKSTNGGLTWTAMNSGLTNLYVGSLRMHPFSPNTLFAATGVAGCSGQPGNEQWGLFRSVNGGETWTKVISNDLMTTVNFAPSNPEIVYAGSQFAFYRSSDGGLTWSSYSKSGHSNWGPEGVRPGFPIDVVVDPTAPNLLYANNYGGGVFRSTDGAQTWEIWSKGYSGAEIRAVHIPPASPSTVLATGNSGPYRSVNYGRDWKGIDTGQADISSWTTLITDPRDDATILMADDHQGAIKRSADAGASFVTVFRHPQADASNVQTRQGFKTFAIAPSSPNTIYAGVAREVIWLEQGGTPVGRVIYKSTDNGRTFAAAGAALDGKNIRRLLVDSVRPDTVWAATSGGVYKSTDGATSWTLIGMGGKNIVALAGNVNNSVLVASEKERGIWFSNDGGSSWSGPSTTGFNSPNPYVMSLTFDASGTLYAADYYSGVYSSIDQGRSWRAFPDSLMTGLKVRSAKDVTVANDTVYVGTQGGGVFALFGLVSHTNLATNYSDWWADPSYGGSSMNISQQGNSLGLAWYFYDTAGTPTWIFGGGDLSWATASLTLLRATGVTLGSPMSVTGVPIGTATITFTSDSSATFAFTYSGTSAYSGRSGQLSLRRYTLASLPIAGTYKYVAKVVQSGCTLPASEGTDYPFGTLVITAASGTITVSNQLSTGNVCNYSAPYVQNGSKISTDGSYTCTNGAYGNGHFDYAFTDDSVQITGTGQQTAGGSTCQMTFWRSGVRQ